MLNLFSSTATKSLRSSLFTAVRFNFAEENEPELTAENAQKVIEKWVKNNSVCLFMKGTPAAPQCGYSNFVV